MTTITRSACGSPIVVEEPVLPSHEPANRSMAFWTICGTLLVEPVHRLPSLEVDVRVLGSPPDRRPVRRQPPPPVGKDQLVVDHGPHVVEGELLDLLYLMGGPEAVEEVQKGHPGFQRGGLGDEGEVHGLLDALRAEHGKAGGPGRHDVGMVAEDAERLGGEGAGGNMEDGRVSSPAILYMLGIISRSPCDAVKVVVRAPVVSEPWTAPATPASDCIWLRGHGPPDIHLARGSHGSQISAMGEEGVMG